jgi:N-acetylneuraminic acid mutarotase
MKLRKLVSSLLTISLFFGFTACDNESDDEEELGNWVKSSYFEGQPRSGSVVFTIGNKAYVGMGYDGDDYFSDFYAYDLDRGLWDDIAPFPGLARERGVAFTINGKGYVGLGYNRDQDVEELGDLWEYNPADNTWKRLADFQGSARYNSVAFALGGKGYVGTGYDGDFYRSDFWSYEPSTDTWLEVASFPGGKREEALAVVYNNKAYFCTGRNNGVYDADIWEFDPAQENWKEITPDDDEDYYDDFTSAVRRHDAVGFSINDKIYIATGVASGGSTDNQVFEFNPSTGGWDKKTSFEGSSRSLAVAFVLNNRAFVGTGQNSSRRWDDVWEFFPDIEYDEED